jgi:ferric-dicitrate binding protein FerR (iron transport regulator)
MPTNSENAARIIRAIERFKQADREWSALLDRPQDRYRKAGQGEPGTELRAAFERRCAAYREHNEAWQERWTIRAERREPIVNLPRDGRPAPRETQ